MIGRRLRYVLVAMAALAAACGGSEERRALDGAVADPPLLVGDQQLPEGENGQPFTFQASPGELLAVYFGYTQCPDLCPTTMADLKVALGELGGDADRVSVAMVTVDPERDNARLLNAYLSGFFGEEHVHALRTTDSEQLKTVESAFLATSSVKRTNKGFEVEHTATTSIVNDEGVVVVQWPFGTSPESMAHDLEIILTDEAVAKA